jgi:poly-beta-1,6-N-acetyl-D-glucosamine synthase
MDTVTNFTNSGAVNLAIEELHATLGFLVITPARNEENGIEETIRSMATQTLRPTEWVIVNDGSNDRTGAILDQYAAKLPWITVVHRPDRGCRKPGGGVIEAFYDGLKASKIKDWQFVVKLDADLTLDPDYFERCLSEFELDPQLGVGGGAVYEVRNRTTVVDSTTAFHVRGATKIYRRECWNALGGLLVAPGWDTLDEVKANMHGWKTRSFSHIPILQRRPTGGQDGAWRDYEKNGRANYICGYHPLFMTAKCISRIWRKPRVVSAVALAYGFLGAWIRQTPRVNDKELIAYIRKQQLRRMLGQASIWK